MPSTLWKKRAPPFPLSDARFEQEKARCAVCRRVFWRRKVKNQASRATPRRTCSENCRQIHGGRHGRTRRETKVERRARLSRIAKLPRRNPTSLPPQFRGRHPANCTPEAQAKTSRARKDHFRRQRMADALEATRRTELTRHQVQRLRHKIAISMEEQLALAHLVVTGAPNPETGETVTWSPTQARVFGMLLNKVVPDLHASFTQHDHRNKPLEEMSREELELIASGARDLADGKRRKPPEHVIDMEAAEIEDAVFASAPDPDPDPEDPDPEDPA